VPAILSVQRRGVAAIAPGRRVRPKGPPQPGGATLSANVRLGPHGDFRSARAPRHKSDTPFGDPTSSRFTRDARHETLALQRDVRMQRTQPGGERRHGQRPGANNAEGRLRQQGSAKAGR